MHQEGINGIVSSDFSSVILLNFSLTLPLSQSTLSCSQDEDEDDDEDWQGFLVCFGFTLCVWDSAVYKCT